MLHAHHQEVAPELAPYASDDESWPVRRGYYEGVLAQGGRALVARDGGEDVGYLMAARDHCHWPATFAEVGEVAEVTTLLVRPELRGSGLGSQLLDAFDDWRGEV